MNKEQSTPAAFLGQTPLQWLSNGGTAANGVTYGRPRSASPWGTAGCPLLPRAIREELNGIKVPQKLEVALGSPLTFDELDSTYVERFRLDELSNSIRAAFRSALYEVTYSRDIVVIPAGVPLAWLKELPITGRTRGAVNRAYLKYNSENFLIAPIPLHQFLALYEVGTMTFINLACVMESAEVEDQTSDQAFSLTGMDESISAQLSISGPYFDDMVNQAALKLVQESSPLTTGMHQFAKWALAETQATTLWEAFAEIINKYTGTQAWASVASIKLAELMPPPVHPYEILNVWAMKQDLRERTVFWARISGSIPKVTLQELAAEFGVTRERIRQVEVRVRRAFERFLNDYESSPIHWRAETVNQVLGVAGKFNTVADKLEAPAHCRDYSAVIVELSGPYVNEKGWYVLESALQDEPTPWIIAQADEAGRIDSELASRCLTEWGLDVVHHRDWLTRNGDIRQFNNQLVCWGNSISDRLVFALADLGRIATLDEMMSHVGETRPRQSVANAIGSDSRLIRVSRTHWGLSSWELPEYAGTAYSIRSFIEEAGGSMLIGEVVQLMHQTFEVAEGTTKTYFQSPMFVTEGDSIRLRAEEDGPYKLDLRSIDRATGVFHLGPYRAGVLLKVDHNVLRGSGSLLSRAAGAILQVDVNANLKFTDQWGNVLVVTFPETSFMGPSLGSIRLIAESLSANEGDYVTLVLDRSNMSVEAVATKPNSLSPGWATVGRLTGITEPVSMPKLADSLHCATGEVRARLNERGDSDVLDALSKPKTSSKLAEALSMLQIQVEKGR